MTPMLAIRDITLPKRGRGQTIAHSKFEGRALVPVFDIAGRTKQERLNETGFLHLGPEEKRFTGYAKATFGGRVTPISKYSCCRKTKGSDSQRI
jgi:hypothetical protein